MEAVTLILLGGASSEHNRFILNSTLCRRKGRYWPWKLLLLASEAAYAENEAERRVQEIVLVNCRLEDANLVPTMRKPFDAIAEGLLSEK